MSRMHQVYDNALAVQNAVNLSGIVKSLSRDLEAIFEEVRTSGGGTDDVNTHPAVVLYVTQLANLALKGTAGPFDQYSEAYRICTEKVANADLAEALEDDDDNHIVDAVFVSVWDGGIEIKSPCKLDVCSGRVFDIEIVTDNADMLDVCDGEFVESPSGDSRMEVEQGEDGDFYVLLGELCFYCCRYCGGNCPNEPKGSENLCDGFAGDIDGLY